MKKMAQKKGKQQEPVGYVQALPSTLLKPFCTQCISEQRLRWLSQVVFADIFWT